MRMQYSTAAKRTAYVIHMLIGNATCDVYSSYKRQQNIEWEEIKKDLLFFNNYKKRNPLLGLFQLFCMCENFHKIRGIL